MEEPELEPSAERIAPEFPAGLVVCTPVPALARADPRTAGPAVPPPLTAALSVVVFDALVLIPLLV